MNKIASILGMVLCLKITTGCAAYLEELPKIQSESFKWTLAHANACLKADNIHRVNANGECLAIQSYFANNQLPQKNARLLIFIHGDGIVGGSPSDYLKFQATQFVDKRTNAIVVIRPGYYDSYDNYSTGESYAFACKGYPCDGYRENTIATLAATIQQLKSYYQPSCTILVGHSGGAMMSSVILGKYPNLANGAVLASTTNNVHQWTKRHGWGNWPHSLSPHDWIKTIPKNNFVTIISGAEDKNTYPEYASAYYDSLKRLGIKAQYINVPNGTHDSIVTDNTTAFNKAIKNALQICH